MAMDVWPCGWRRRALRLVALGCLLAGAVLLTDYWVGLRTRAAVQDDISHLTAAPVALVLGTAKQARHGENLFYRARINAAAALYKSGKVRGIIVSGDNSRLDYDEATDMRDDLVALGVPAAYITRDFAGFRTLDSVLRCRDVFGQRDVIVVSQRFHCERAVFIAEAHGLQAQGYAAADPPRGWSLRVRAREVLARNLAVADVYLLRRGPKFLGPQETVILADVRE